MTTKKILIIRHGLSFGIGRLRICRPQARLKLLKRARADKFLGKGAISVFSAPEWDTRYTAKKIAEMLKTAPFTEVASLSEKTTGPIDDDFIRARLAAGDSDIFVTHFKRMSPVLAAIQRVLGKRLRIDKGRMRHLNRAFLVDLENERVLIIKENS